MYCSNCGKEIDNRAVICPYCGVPVSGAELNASREKDSDESGAGWAVLSFFVPIVGLILFLIWQNDYPLRAKACGKGALINVIVCAAIAVLSFLLAFTLIILSIPHIPAITSAMLL